MRGTSLPGCVRARGWVEPVKPDGQHGCAVSDRGRGGNGDYGTSAAPGILTARRPAINHHSLPITISRVCKSREYNFSPDSLCFTLRTVSLHL